MKIRNIYFVLILVLLACNTERNDKQLSPLYPVKSSEKWSDSIIGNWRLTLIQFKAKKKNQRGFDLGTITNQYCPREDSMLFSFEQNKTLKLNNKIIGKWGNVGNDGIKFVGNHFLCKYPIFFETPYFISRDHYNYFLKAKFRDDNGTHHNFIYWLVKDDKESK